MKQRPVLDGVINPKMIKFIKKSVKNPDNNA